MASINVRKDTGKLYLDFRYRNQRCREQTSLTDTIANRKKLQRLLDKIEAEILLGQFDYKATFPDSSALKKIEAVNRTLAASVNTVPTLKAFCETWFNENKVQWGKKYTRDILRIIEQHIVPFFGECLVNEVSKQQVLAFRSEICQRKSSRGETLAPDTINRHLKIIRAILNEAADRFEFVTPYRGIKMLKVQKTDIKPFKPEEISIFLDCVRDDFYEYFLIRFFTGMRTGEIDGLQWKYVDFENRLIKIRETLVEGEDSYTKTDASQRDIQMSEPVYKAFIAMKKRTFCKHKYVFVNLIGNPLNQENVTKRVWYPLLSFLGFEKRNPYQTRHTAATLWLASGESPEWIARQLGHSNTEMLFRVYSRYVPNLTRQDGSAANKLLTNVIGAL